MLKEYDEESAVWVYARTLLAIPLSGRTEPAARELRSALKVNVHVPELIASDEPIPQPPHYAPGSIEEACIAAEELRPAFQATPGALEWIAQELEERFAGSTNGTAKGSEKNGLRRSSEGGVDGDHFRENSMRPPETAS